MPLATSITTLGSSRESSSHYRFFVYILTIFMYFFDMLVSACIVTLVLIFFDIYDILGLIIMCNNMFYY